MSSEVKTTKPYVAEIEDVDDIPDSSLFQHTRPKLANWYTNMVSKTQPAVVQTSAQQAKPLQPPPLIKVKNPDELEKWLLPAVKQHKYTVLLAFRGSWCGVCKSYMSAASKLREECEKRNIGVYSVCSQETPEYLKKIVNEWEMAYPVVSDVKNSLAKLFDLSISTVKAQEKIRVATARVYKMFGMYNKDQDDMSDMNKDGMVQPNIVVIDRRCLEEAVAARAAKAAAAPAGKKSKSSASSINEPTINDIKPFYVWKLRPMDKNGFGTYSRVFLDHVLTIVDFYDQSYNRNLAVGIAQNHTLRKNAFRLVMQDAELRRELHKHLEEEYNEDLLLFLDEYDALAHEGNMMRASTSFSDMTITERKTVLTETGSERSSEDAEDETTDDSSSIASEAQEMASSPSSAVPASPLSPTSPDLSEGKSPKKSSKKVSNLLKSIVRKSSTPSIGGKGTSTLPSEFSDLTSTEAVASSKEIAQQRIERMRKMAADYLSQGAAQELNLPAQIRNQFFVVLNDETITDAISKEQMLCGLLANIASQVRHDVQTDSFIRFLVSPRVVTVVKKYPHEFTAVAEDLVEATKIPSASYEPGDV